MSTIKKGDTGVFPRVDLNPVSSYPPHQPDTSWNERRILHIEKTKADKELVTAEINNLKERMNELTKEVSAVQEEGHVCINEPQLENIKNNVRENTESIRQSYQAYDTHIKGAYKQYIRIITGLLLFFITTGTAVVWFVANLSFNVSNNEQKVDKIERSVKEIKDSRDKNVDTDTDLKNIIKQAVQDAMTTVDYKSK